ncbi:phosphoglucomutase-2-like [Pollicipes pollicipes]|uniref:phosphoglucomutase-2-like n=1 Tax=Pollicipes pollicipes TaxID=41117 RepID=UPI001884EF74|nr:phosphoglucomutase-2-like [Pollicipes pollicipes]
MAQAADPALNAKINEWLSWDKNEETHAEISQLHQAEDWAQLRKLLLQRMTFGTAGLRGRMGAGYGCMNDLVIVQTTQGLARYLLQTVPDAAGRGVVVGYDGRYHSRRFAELTTAVLLQLKVRVWLFSKICPTPWVAFGCKHFGAAAGIMVTASHNPKEDNGYKVYWDNGAQIIPPHDRGIQRSIEEQLEPWPGSWDVSAVGGVTDPGAELTAAYLALLTAAAPHPEQHAGSPLLFTVTSMHGVSHPYMVEAFKACGFKPFVPVVEQMEADPEFPTVPFPNPEEGKSALNLAMATADAAGSTVILANDPDADRLAVAEKQASGGWRVFNGNEVGALLGWWCWHAHQQRPAPRSGADCYMLASTVSSKILRAIADKEGFHFEETLTGFKWMANKAVELEAAGKTVLFAFEEAIGFMCGTAVLDKDGISAALAVAQLATFLSGQGVSLAQHLDYIYDTYGFHTTNNSYYICHDPSVVRRLFERIRSLGGSPGTVSGYESQASGMNRASLGTCQGLRLPLETDGEMCEPLISWQKPKAPFIIRISHSPPTSRTTTVNGNGKHFERVVAVKCNKVYMPTHRVYFRCFKTYVYKRYLLRHFVTSQIIEHLSIFVSMSVFIFRAKCFHDSPLNTKALL